MYAVLCPDGALNKEDMIQCQNEQWVPLAVYRPNGIIHLLCFRDYKVAANFFWKNYPRGWLFGIVELSDEEIFWAEEQGWKIEILNYPRKLKDRPDFGYEVLQFQSVPDLHILK